MESNPSRTKLNSGHQDYPPLSRDITIMTRGCHLLEQGDIKSCDLLYHSSNIVFLVTLAQKSKGVTAVYKPRRGETPLYDFPDGTLYKREYATFLISLALEWVMVPPTVIRSGPHGIGSVQWFVDTAQRTDYSSLRSKYLSELKQVALFDYLINNADRKAGHCLEGQDGRLWLVDHGLTFNAIPKLRTVIWDFSGQSIPGKLISDVASLQQKLAPGKPLREALSKLLDEAETEALEQRLKRIIDNPVFPYPSSHRSMPWPWL